jgi:hypothetical protein
VWRPDTHDTHDTHASPFVSGNPHSYSDAHTHTHAERGARRHLCRWI